MNIHITRCEHCDEGRVLVSRYGGNDPDVWTSRSPCEECDGKGNIEVEDPYGMIDPASVTTKYDSRWYDRKDGAASAWMATDGRYIAYAHTSVGAVTKLIEQAEEMAELAA